MYIHTYLLFECLNIFDRCSDVFEGLHFINKLHSSVQISPKDLHFVTTTQSPDPKLQQPKKSNLANRPLTLNLK